MTISDSFGLLIERIQPLESELAAAQRHLAEIRACLRNEFKVSNCKTIGSFARGTSIRGVSDTDLLAVFRREEFTWDGRLINSDTALDNVRQALIQRYPSSDIRRDGIAIAIGFSDGRQVDVVPAVFHSMHGKWSVYQIPDGSGAWMKSCPGLYDAHIAQANQESGRKLIYVAQLMKFWRERRSPRIPLSSFHIEMVLASESVCRVAKPYTHCMLDIFRSLIRRQCGAMRDEHEFAGNIAAVKTAAQRERALSAIITSRDCAQRAIDAHYIDDARQQWNRVFTDKFPW